jgi:predicted RNA-binding protein YlqC (UPF0109 family)
MPRLGDFLDYAVRGVVSDADAVEVMESKETSKGRKKHIEFSIALSDADREALEGNEALLAALETMLDAAAYKRHLRASFVLAGASDDAEEEDED